MQPRSAVRGARVVLVALGALALAPWHTADAAPPESPSASFPTMRDEVIAAVLSSNSDLASARFAWEAARTVPVQVRALPDPVLTWDVAPGTVGAADVGLGQRIGFRQVVPFPGSLAPQSRAAVAHADALGVDVEAAARRLALEAARLVDRLGVIDASLALMAQHAELLGELRTSAEARYAAGTAGAQDPIQADVELAHVEHRVVLLTAERRAESAGLNALMHRAPDAPFPSAPIDALPTKAAGLAPRPELRAAEARQRSAAQIVTATRRGTLPDLMLSGSYNSMWMAPAHQWLVGVGVEVPLHIGVRRAAVREAEARAAEARASQDAVKDQLAAELEQARARFAEALQVVRLFDERLLPAARSRMQVARAAFESGSEDFDTVIDGERALRDAHLGRAQAIAGAWTRQAELQLASGQIPHSSRSKESTP